MNFWIDWIRNNFFRFVNGEWLQVPEYLPHPEYAGFAQIGIAENHGQINNYAVSFADGSRLHIHEYQDGRLVAHRDKYDPDKGVINTALHFFTETNVGKVAGICLIVAAIGTALIKGQK